MKQIMTLKALMTSQEVNRTSQYFRTEEAFKMRGETVERRPNGWYLQYLWWSSVHSCCVCISVCVLLEAQANYLTQNGLLIPRGIQYIIKYSAFPHNAALSESV